jgi:Suppressor of fused protein (SUFU)
VSLIPGVEYETDLLRFYLASLKYEGATELLEFLLAQNEPQRRAVVKVARMELPCIDGSRLWFTGSLGHAGAAYDVMHDHEHQFVAIVDQDARSLSELVASTYHFHRFVERLDYGHTFPVGNAALHAAGYSAAIVLDSSLYQHFSRSEALVAGIPTKLYSVIPIEQKEFDTKRAGGLDALFDLWDAERKDILHVNRP